MDAYPLLDLGDVFGCSISLPAARRIQRIEVVSYTIPYNGGSGYCVVLDGYIKSRAYMGWFKQKDLSEQYAMAELLRVTVTKKITEFVNAHSKPEKTQIGEDARQHFVMFLDRLLRLGININSSDTLKKIVSNYEESISK